MLVLCRAAHHRLTDVSTSTTQDLTAYSTLAHFTRHEAGGETSWSACDMNIVFDQLPSKLCVFKIHLP